MNEQTLINLEGRQAESRAISMLAQSAKITREKEAWLIDTPTLVECKVSATPLLSGRHEPAKVEEDERLAQAVASLTTLPFQYEGSGFTHPIVFNSDGTFSYGTTDQELTWRLVAEGIELWLEISSKEEVTSRLQCDTNGTWVGSRLQGDKIPVCLSIMPPTGDDDYLETFLPPFSSRPIFLATLQYLQEETPDSAILVEINAASPCVEEQDADGWSTRCFAWYAAAFGAELHSVNPVDRQIREFESAIARYSSRVSLHSATGTDFLRTFRSWIDLLYLAGWDEDPGVRRVQYLDAYDALPKKPRSILLKAYNNGTSAEMLRLELVLRALTEGYEIAFQSTHYLFLTIDSLVSERPHQRANQKDFVDRIARTSTFRLSRDGAYMKPYPVRVFSHDRGDFRSLNNENVLIYWPHGFGDFVFLSYILPLMRRTNRYWVARFGDDSSAIFDSSAYANPLFLGINSPHCDDGENFGSRHFGLSYDSIDGSIQVLTMPLALADRCEKLNITAMLWSGLPEIHGEDVLPFHTKARHLIPYLADPGLVAAANLQTALPSAISFEVAAWLKQWVESRLRNVMGFGQRRLCIISRNGYTAAGKNWGHLWRDDMPKGAQEEGAECRDFMRLLLKKERNWTFLIMEDILFGGQDTLRTDVLHAFSYAQVFGSVGTPPPFGLVLKALLDFADLVIGVPTGPYHLAMAKPGLPTIGLWIEHLPSWYDEPKHESIHLISRNVKDRDFHLRPGSFDACDDLVFRSRWLETRTIPGQRVLEAAEMLLH